MKPLGDERENRNRGPQERLSNRMTPSFCNSETGVCVPVPVGNSKLEFKDSVVSGTNKIV